jgi:hypothetical protein
VISFKGGLHGDFTIQFDEESVKRNALLFQYPGGDKTGTLDFNASTMASLGRASTSFRLLFTVKRWLQSRIVF